MAVKKIMLCNLKIIAPSPFLFDSFGYLFLLARVYLICGNYVLLQFSVFPVNDDIDIFGKNIENSAYT